MFAWIMTTLTFAALPWGVSQFAILWQPKLQDRRHRRNFRYVTAIAVTLITIPTMPYIGAGPWLYFGAVAAAIALDVHWYRWQRTRNGRNQLQQAKAKRQAEREMAA